MMKSLKVFGLKKVGLITMVVIGLLLTLYFMQLPADKNAENSNIDIKKIQKIAVGLSKIEILNINPFYSFDSQSKSAGCATGWLRTKLINNSQKKCLLDSKTWLAAIGPNDYCPANKRQIISLYFEQSVLKRINLKCLADD